MSNRNISRAYLRGVMMAARWAEDAKDFDPYMEFFETDTPPSVELLNSILQYRAKEVHWLPKIRTEEEANGFFHAAREMFEIKNRVWCRNDGRKWAETATPEQRKRIASLGQYVGFAILDHNMQQIDATWPNQDFFLRQDSGSQGFVEGVRDWIKDDKTSQPITLSNDGETMVIRFGIDDDLEMLPVVLSAFEKICPDRHITPEERATFEKELREARQSKASGDEAQPIAAE